MGTLVRSSMFASGSSLFAKVRTFAAKRDCSRNLKVQFIAVYFLTVIRDANLSSFFQNVQGT